METKEQLKNELWYLALKWLDTDCAISSVLLGTIAALKIGASHELAIYLLDFSKQYLTDDVKRKLQIDLDLVEKQTNFAERSLAKSFRVS